MNEKIQLDSGEEIKINNLREIYENIYNDCKTKISSAKLKYRLAILGLVAIVIGSFIGMVLSENEYSLNIFTAILTFGTFYFLYKILKKGSAYKKIYKEDFLNNYINNVTPYLNYDSALSNKTKEESIKLEYINAGLDKERFTSFLTDNFIEGKLITGENIKISDTIVWSEKVNTGIAVTSTTTKDLLKGCFVVIDKKNDCNVKIYSEKLVKSKENMSGLIEEEFYKYFKVECNNNEDKYKYLTPEITKYLISFREKYKFEFDIAIKDKIYIKFHCGTIFNAKVLGKKVDEDAIYKYYIVTKFIEEFINLIDELN